MNFPSNISRGLVVAIVIAVFCSASQGAVVLHTTYGQLSGNISPNDGTDDTPMQIAAGYASHLTLSNSLPVYQAVGEISAGGGCTATWIGNDASGAWLLTAAHCGGNPANDSQSFTAWDGLQTYTSPAGSWTRFDSPDYVPDDAPTNFTGEAFFDIALMRLDGMAISINDSAGNTVSQPVLYSGTAEQGELVTWVGYGVRGTGLIGQQDDVNDDFTNVGDWGAGRAAAQNIIDTVRDDGTDTELLFDFDDPDDLPNPTVNGFEGHLSSGDSGGGAFLTIGGATVLAGVVSESGAEFYVDGTGAGENALTRVSGAQSFISSNFSGAQFSAVPEPSAFLFLGLGGVLMGLRRYVSLMGRAID